MPPQVHKLLLLLAPVRFNELLDKFFNNTFPPLPINFGTFGKWASADKFSIALLAVFPVMLIVILFVALSLPVRFGEFFVKFFNRARPSLPPIWTDAWPQLKTTTANDMSKDSTRSFTGFLVNSFSQSLKCPVLVSMF